MKFPLWRPTERKTRVGIHANDNCVSGERIAILSNEVSDVNDFKQRKRWALEKYPCLAACASRWRQPSLLANDTRPVVTWLSGHESMDNTQSVLSSVSVGCERGLSMFPTPCDCEQARRQKPDQTRLYSGRSRVWTTKHSRRYTVTRSFQCQ